MREKNSSGKRNWLESINWQIDFYQRSNEKYRTDTEFPWFMIDSKKPVQVLRRTAKRALHLVGLRRPPVLKWLNNNAEQLWEARSLLNDDLSKVIFDSVIVLRSTGYRQFYFPRINFDDFLEIVDEIPFLDSALPNNYLGLPLKLFDVRLREHPNSIPMKILSCKENLDLINSYRQYLIRRNSIDISPVAGEVVLDCGACIGEVSLIFAGLVGTKGEVHLFDPVPLHSRFCRHQASLNPSLGHVLHVNELAIMNRTTATSGNKQDSNQIAPGGLAVDSFASTSIDDYVGGKLHRVNYIKMDIEGAEMEAIEGAVNTIREFKPRLAISAYHAPSHLWEIPIKLKALNPGYDLYFGHHSPMDWESVFYAVQHPRS